MMRTHSVALVLAGSLLAGCATRGTAVATDSSSRARASESGLSGETFSIQRDDTGLRGTSAGAPVALEWSAEGVKGTYRSLPVKLSISGSGGAHVASGELAGSNTAFRFSAEKIEGYVAGCAVKAQRQGDGTFAGGQTCGAHDPRPLRFSLPQSLWTRGAPERAAWIALTVSESSQEPRSLGGPGHAGVIHSQYREKIPSQKCNTRAMGD